MSELKQALLQSHLCKYLDLNDLDLLMTYSKTINFPAGAILLEQGKQSIGTYMIIEGEAVVTAKVLGAGSVNLMVLDQGHFIGEISLMLKTPSTVSVTARSVLQCLFISSSYFDMLTLFFPATKYKISKAITEDVSVRLKSISKKIMAFMAHAHMSSKSLFGEVFQSLNWPSENTLEGVAIKPEHLQEHTFFNALTKEQFTILLQHVTVLEAVNHCPLIKEGDKNNICYVILRGAVQARLRQVNKHAKLCVLPPMNLFCNMAYVDGTPSMFEYFTCERCVLLKISESSLDDLKKNHIEIWYFLYGHICQSFAALEQAASKLDIRLNSELYNR
jgi:CRP/FNR family cyclic AMP-dependent transcriptional regulator